MKTIVTIFSVHLHLPQFYTLPVFFFHYRPCKCDVYNYLKVNRLRFYNIACFFCFLCYTVHSMLVWLCLKSFVKEREIKNIYIYTESESKLLIIHRHVFFFLFFSFFFLVFYLSLFVLYVHLKVKVRIALLALIIKHYSHVTLWTIILTSNTETGAKNNR